MSSLFTRTKLIFYCVAHYVYLKQTVTKLFLYFYTGLKDSEEGTCLVGPSISNDYELNYTFFL